jgi:RNA polymerase sigma-70 factor (ECF subfamily)
MTTAEDSDETLMAAFARGDGAAFDALYRRHEMRIWRYLFRHLGERAAAEDSMQDVWFAVAREAGNYRPTARFTTWLFTLAHNRMVDAFRARRPQADPKVLEELPDAGAGPLALTLARDQRTALARMLEQLPAEQREAFLLQAEAELPVEEIAGIMGSSFETTKSRLRYARAKLRELLQEYA